jgi:hypothetical protein
MEFITRPIERWLWPRRGQGPAVVSRQRMLARYAYALARDLAHGALNLRAMSLVYTTMVAIVPLLAFVFALIKAFGLHRDFLEPLLLRFLTPLGNERAGELTQRIVGFVDNVSGLALGFFGVAILLFTALSMAQKVESSFNFVWRVDRPRSLARRFLHRGARQHRGRRILDRHSVPRHLARGVGLAGALRAHHRELQLPLRVRAEHTRPTGAGAHRRRVRRHPLGRRR